jgi:hypothetical protein
MKGSHLSLSLRQLCRDSEPESRNLLEYRATSARWQEILDAEGVSEEEAVADFKRWRAEQKR